MVIGIPYSNGEIFQHFGKAPQFAIYTVTNKEIVSTEIIDAMGHGHGNAVSIFTSKGVDTVICGGMGTGAYNGLQSAGIFLVYPGVSGLAENAVKKLINGELELNLGAVHACHHS